jgi:hypothetical protein
LSVYHALLSLQGSKIPTLFSAVQLEVPLLHGHANAPPEVLEYISIPGVLTEFIEGFKSPDTAISAPKADWLRIRDAAVGVVNEVTWLPAINYGVHPRNVIIQKKNKKKNEYEGVMADFRYARVRRQDECDQEWRERKWLEDEEDSVAVPMARELGYEFDQCKKDGGHMR